MKLKTRIKREIRKLKQQEYMYLEDLFFLRYKEFVFYLIEDAFLRHYCFDENIYSRRLKEKKLLRFIFFSKFFNYFDIITRFDFHALVIKLEEYKEN